MANVKFNKEMCTGCGSCSMACMNQHSTDIYRIEPLRTITRKESVIDGKVILEFESLSCLHCRDAPCAASCPAGCITRDEELDIVLLDNSQCIGCGRCARACPHSAIRIHPDGKAEKCDGCISRQKQGLLPACVKACPFGALTI